MNDTYDGISAEQWQKELSGQSDWNARHLMIAFATLGLPKTFLDVGCGDGTMVNVARHLGVLSYGVDQLIDDQWDKTAFSHHNLVDRYVHPYQCELVLCLEVAEHLHPSAHATLCDTLVGNLKEGRGNYLIFSAALPNQGGIGHVAERPPKYWMDQFALRGLNFRRDLTINLSLHWSNIGSPLTWLAANVQVWEK